MTDPFVAMQIRNQLRFRGRVRLRRPKKWLFPTPAERAMESHILETVGVIENLAKALVIPQLQRLAGEASRVRGDAWSDDLENLSRQLRIRIDLEGRDERQVAATAAAAVSDWNSREWRSIVRQSVGIDIFTPEPWLRDDLRSWSRETADLITTLEDDAVRQVSRWTNRGIREGWRWEDIAKNIEDRFEVSRSRARFIARDQTAKLNGDLTERRQTQTGVTHYFWRDSRDERVRGNPGGRYPNARPSHWDRNGQRFAWADAPEGGHPGKDYNCRCYAEPDLRGLLEAFK